MPNPFDENVMPPIPVFASNVSYINSLEEACFVLSKKDGTIQIFIFPPLDRQEEVRFQQIDLKQDTWLGLTKNLFTGIVPSYLKSTNTIVVNESASHLLVHSTDEDDLIYAFCLDSKVRVISLRNQTCIILQALAHLSDNLNSNKISTQILSARFWWSNDNPDSRLPNIVLHVSVGSTKIFYFYETIIPSHRSFIKKTIPQAGVLSEETPQLRLIFQIFSPKDQILTDYFIYKNRIWVMLKQGNNWCLQFKFISTSDSEHFSQASWIPSCLELVQLPLECSIPPLSNPREFYLNEIFWKGHFDIEILANVLSELHNVKVPSDLSTIKIDQLVRDAIQFVDDEIHSKLLSDQGEFEMQEYCELEEKFWSEIYKKCAQTYHNHNRPLALFVDYRTGVRGLVRAKTLTFLPEFEPFDNLISAYSLLCCNSDNSNKGLASAWIQHEIQFLVESFSRKNIQVPSRNIEKSLLSVLTHMATINKSLSEVDLQNFQHLIKRISSFSCKANLSLSDVGLKITEETDIREKIDPSLVEEISEFFEECPLVIETMNFIVSLLAFEYGNDPYSVLNPNSIPVTTDMIDKNLNRVIVSHDTSPIVSGLLQSKAGLEFVFDNIQHLIDSRFRFCRDFLLFQYMLIELRDDLTLEDSACMVPIEKQFVPRTVELLVAYDFLNWVTRAPMFPENFWNKNSKFSYPKQSQLDGTTGKNFMAVNIVSILQLHYEYVGTHFEKAFYHSYPRSNAFHMFVEFSGGISARRLLSYNVQNRGLNHQNITSFGSAFSSIVSEQLYVICDLLWPFTAGQLSMGEFLLSIGQYNLLEQFLHRLNVPCMPYEASRSFLKGLCCLVTSEGEKAISHFKKSMSGINVEPLMVKMFSEEKVPFLMNIQNELDSQTVYNYFCKLIQLFKSYSSYDLIVEITELAKRSLEKSNDPEFNAEHSYFSTTLFGSHLLLGNNNKAYEAMLDCCDIEEQKNCLKLFVMTLCENGQFEQLVSFSYAGLEEEFVNVLESKARISSTFTRSGLGSISTVSRISESTINSTGSRQCFYYILYAYFLRINNYRRAAQTLYDYYRKLSVETISIGEKDALEILKEQVSALLLARQCLKLVDKNHQWIVKNFIKKSEENEIIQGSLKRKLGAHGTPNRRAQRVVDIVDADELLSEYELISSRYDLLKLDFKEYSVAASILTPEETMTLCVSASLYRNAFRIAECFKLSVEAIFDGMSSKYVHILDGTCDVPSGKNENISSVVDYMRDRNNNSLQLICEQFNDEIANGFTNHSSKLQPSNQMWALIMYYLKREEKYPKKSSKLMKIVSEKLLSNGIALPGDLLSVYKRVHFEELLRLYMTYNYLTQATQLTVHYIRALFAIDSPQNFGLQVRQTNIDFCCFFFFFLFFSGQFLIKSFY